MKIFKKALALVMLIIMIANMSVFAVSFSDVSANSEAERYISLMAEKGIIKGVSENSFAPDATCTREQFLTFLWRAEGSFGVGKPTDREHAVYYLYNFAKLTNKADTKKTALLNPYSDKGDISLDSVLPVAWAVEFGILSPEADVTLNPKGEINRAFAATAIGKLLEHHMHDWSAWEDLGNGTHKRVCKTDASHTEEGAHTFNAGELTIAPTDTTKGLITYTCSCCLLTKTEEAPAGAEIVTRKDIEDAVIAVATAYHAKGTKMQYDSTGLSDVSPNHGGASRLTTRSAPEWATEDSTFYSVCTNYIYQSYNEALSKEFKDGQLEAGDIIVSVMAKDKNNLTYDFENINVYVYDGSRLLCSRKTPEGVTYEIVPEENVLTELTKLYMTDKDLFFALRPSQVK